MCLESQGEYPEPALSSEWRQSKRIISCLCSFLPGNPLHGVHCRITQSTGFIPTVEDPFILLLSTFSFTHISSALSSLLASVFFWRGIDCCLTCITASAIMLCKISLYKVSLSRSYGAHHLEEVLALVSCQLFIHTNTLNLGSWRGWEEKGVFSSIQLEVLIVTSTQHSAVLHYCHTDFIWN